MAKGAKVTPMMEQYLAIKAKHQDAVLFFRMGDFYEMFFEDAKVASEVLGLTLTSRGGSKPNSVPLAGFPYHSLDTYLGKMVKAGHRVAICEQLEDPKKAKTVVKRDVTEVVSPGTVITDDLLDSKRNNYLAGIYVQRDICGLALVDISTGEFTVDELPIPLAAEELKKVSPSELLVSDDQLRLVQDAIAPPDNIFLTRRDDWVFARDHAYDTLLTHFNTLSLKGFGCDELNAGICAAGAILHFLKEVQKYQLVHINALQRQSRSEFVGIDSDTLRNLELLKSMRGGSVQGTLISIVDKTRTPMGGRRLVHWLLKPLAGVPQIRHRHDAVEELHKSGNLLSELREALGRIGDLERIVSKVVTNRASARDLIALKRSLMIIPELAAMIGRFKSHSLREIVSQFDFLESLVAEIEQAIVDEPPLSVTEGGLIKRGFHAELDELRDISFSGKDWIARLQTDERESTGIPSLKVSYNKVFGYYIEVTKPNLAKVPEHYIRKQTLVNAERFITPDLKAYEEKVLDAEEKIVSIEYDLFDKIRRSASDKSRVIQENSRLLSKVDCLAAYAQLAIENRYTRPEVHGGTQIEIREGRHPVVEKLLPYGESFIPNDTTIDSTKEQIHILTGPNMAGKSTFLRQVGLIVLLAQAGSFVPARKASIGVVDKIFTRVGASDNLAGGESTFLVEMNETANILNNATAASLILLDEIGRGTSTFDGLSIAWSVAEYLHNNSSVAAKCIFATHYHELTELALLLPRVRNYNVVVKESGEKIVFLRRIAAGGCDHSYGIQVAKLAGLPDGVIRRAREILRNLESDELTPNHMPKLAAKHEENQVDDRQLDIFTKQERKLRDEMEAINLDDMTPLQALIKLNDLKKVAQG